MTRWGLILLVLYLVLGLMNVDSRKAVRVAVIATIFVIGYESFRLGAI